MWYIEDKGDKLMLSQRTAKKVTKPAVKKVNNFWDNREITETHYARNKKKLIEKARKEKEKQDLPKIA
jgi:hypothetical protein